MKLETMTKIIFVKNTHTTKLEFRYVLAWLRYVQRNAYKSVKKPFWFAFGPARRYNLRGNSSKWNTTSYLFDLFLCINTKWDTTSYWFDLFLGISTKLDTTSYSFDLFLISMTETGVWNQHALQKQTENVFPEMQTLRRCAVERVLLFNSLEMQTSTRKPACLLFLQQHEQQHASKLADLIWYKLADTQNATQLSSNILRRNVSMPSYVRWHYQAHTRQSVSVPSYTRWHYQARTKQSYNKACKCESTFNSEPWHANRKLQTM